MNPPCNTGLSLTTSRSEGLGCFHLNCERETFPVCDKVNPAVGGHGRRLDPLLKEEELGQKLACLSNLSIPRHAILLSRKSYFTSRAAGPRFACELAHRAAVPYEDRGPELDGPPTIPSSLVR